MTTTTDRGQLRTYGNWRRPRSAGLGKLGLVGTIVVFLGAVCSIIAMLVGGLFAGLAVAAVAAIVVGLVSLPDRHGLTPGQHIVTRIGWWRRRRRGSNFYRSGPLGRTPWGTCQLPGLAARSRLFETSDGYGRPMAIVHLPTSNHYAVVIACQPDGAGLVDTEQVDAWVADWGEYLAMLATENVVAASVMIQTGPDSGASLRREQDLNVAEDAHPLARQIVSEITAAYPQASPMFQVWITLTVKGVTAGGKHRKPAAMIDYLRTRMPNLIGPLSAAGAGAATPVSAQQLCEFIRTAYDPAVAEVIDTAHAEGIAVDLGWADVGPAAHDAAWDFYRHDSATSVTWAMSAPPRGVVFSSVLADLLAVHPAIARKRISLLYRPIPQQVAAAMVDADQRSAQFRVNSADRPTARQEADLAAAMSASQEEALGAGLVNFALLATATVTDPAELADAKAAVIALGAAARITMRPVYGAQDSAFAANLPLGLVTENHLSVPAVIRRAS